MEVRRYCAICGCGWDACFVKTGVKGLFCYLKPVGSFLWLLLRLRPFSDINGPCASIIIGAAGTFALPPILFVLGLL